MLNNQSRKNFVKKYKILVTPKKTAQAFGVTNRTVYRLNKRLQVTGSVELKTSTRGRKSKLNEKDLNQISALILEHHDITLQEIKDELKLDFDISVLWMAIHHKLGFTRKKSLYAVTYETWVNIDMTRLYGRSVGNTRIKDSAPINTPKRTGIVGTMRFDGTIRYKSFEGSITGKHFLTFLKQTLLPVLRKGDIVIMDNLSIHKVKCVQELILSAGALSLCLPPYSPDFSASS